MTNFKKGLLLLTVSTIALTGTAYAAAVSTTATVTVQNAITVAETQALTFGTLVSSSSDLAAGADAATLQVSTNGTTTVAGTAALATIIEISAGVPAVFAVSGAAPGATLTLSTPADTKLIDAAAPTAAWFDISGYSFGYTNTDGSPIFTPLVGNDGTLEITMGATLTTDTQGAIASGSEAATPYSDTTYTGTIAFTVNY